MRGRLLSAFFIGCAIICILPGTAQTQRKPITELPEIRELPNPFTFLDRSTVRSKADWERRRSELKGLFQEYVYGALPARPERMTITRGKPVTDKRNNLTVEDIDLILQHESRTLTLIMRLALPLNARNKAPVIVQGAIPPGFGAADSTAALSHFSAYTNRGYAVAELNFQQVARDNKESAPEDGVYALMGNRLDCGTLMAWAWGIQRVIDAVATMPEIDVSRVIVTGHSRYGKAALIAGAFDERIALTVPSHSGCAGVAPYRFIYGKSEQLQNIVGFAPYWFRQSLDEFVRHVDRLPVDQHLLLALVAPRGLLCAEGTLDAWANPEGAQLTYKAAGKVYSFLEAGDKLSIRYRPVGHVPNVDDLLEYADHLFCDRRLSEDFGKLPYPDEPSGFTWDIPR